MTNTPPRPDQAEHFGHWLTSRLTDMGYHLAPRGGGRASFAADSGISPTTISRLLRGEGASDIDVFRLLAKALGEPLPHILVRAGIATEEELNLATHRARNPTNRPQITPEQAADELGITNPEARAAFIASTRVFQHTANSPKKRARN